MEVVVDNNKDSYMHNPIFCQKHEKLIEKSYLYEKCLKNLVICILVQAANDLKKYKHHFYIGNNKLYKNSKKSGRDSFREKVNHYISAERFVRKNNDLFITYCDMVDLDSEYVYEKIWKYVLDDNIKNLYW